MDKDYLDPFLNKKTLRWVEPYHGGMSREDTGLCNRILHWGIAYKINQLNNSKYTILLQDEYWAELKYLRLPNTRSVKNPYYSNNKIAELRFKTVFDDRNQNIYMAEPLFKDDIKTMLTEENFELKGDNYYSDFGYNFVNEFKSIGQSGIPLIQFKHDEFEKIIQNAVKDCVGIHIRRGKGVEITLDHLKSVPKDLKHLFKVQSGDIQYKWISDIQYFKILDGIIRRNPTQKFYLSTDMRTDQYDYILKKYPDNIITRNSILHSVLYTSHYQDLIDDFQFTGFINIVDLFALAHCCFVIKSPASTWSIVASMLRNKPSISIDTNPKELINQVNNFLLKHTPNKVL